MEGFLIVTALIFGAWQIRHVHKYEKKLMQAKAKGHNPLDNI